MCKCVTAPTQAFSLSLNLRLSFSLTNYSLCVCQSLTPPSSTLPLIDSPLADSLSPPVTDPISLPLSLSLVDSIALSHLSSATRVLIGADNSTSLTKVRVHLSHSRVFHLSTYPQLQPGRQPGSDWSVERQPGSDWSVERSECVCIRECGKIRMLVAVAKHALNPEKATHRTGAMSLKLGVAVLARLGSAGLLQ